MKQFHHKAPMMSTNRCVWQNKVGIVGDIQEGEIPSKIADREILVKAHAWAVNPADVIIQDIPRPVITYPLVLGEDIAGTIEMVGSVAASKFGVGDRVLGLALGAAFMKPEQGGFQEHVIIDYAMACKIPDSMSFKDGAVFPLCIATAAHALFSKEYLGMPFPKVNPTSTGKSVLIWGGGSAVGSNAIQLSKFAGFEVITTCSSHNFDYVKSLGANQVFDYTSPSVVDDVAAEVDKSTCIGIFQAAGQVRPPAQVSYKSKQKLLVATTNPVSEGAALDGVEAKMLFSSSGALIYRETSKATFEGFLPEALAEGAYKVAPAPEVVQTRGLEGIQEALNMLKRGVSAKKVVIEAKCRDLPGSYNHSGEVWAT